MLPADSPADSPAPNRAQVLLPIVLAFAGFIALGMINSLLNVGWESMRITFEKPLDALGALLIPNTIGYMLASASSGLLQARLRIGVILAISCALSAGALLSAGTTSIWPILIAMSASWGLGAGAIDASLNNYAANHFSARVMNWLHACFGVGASIGPAIMTFAVAQGFGWRAGFWSIGLMLLALAIYFVATRQIWSQPSAHTHEAGSGTTRSAPFGETLRLPLTWLGILLFFVYTGAEVSTGQWVFSLLTQSRGVATGLAGSWISFYWASLTVGRFLFGLAVQRVAPTTLLRWCMGGALLSALLIWINGALWITFGGIMLMGLTLAPQFPLLISATPHYLGQRHAANGVGLQVASASLGGAILPSMVGVLASHYGIEVLGPFMLAVGLLMLLLFEPLARHMRA